MAGGINIQASDGKYVNVGFEAGASTNVSVTVPKEGGKVVVADALQAQLNGKQNTLVSGTSIKTINSTSLLGSGNIAITETAWTANDSRAKTALNATGTAPIYACRAWVNFNGTGTVAIRASGNVSSITDSGVGAYTVNFTTAMPDTYYSKNVSANVNYALRPTFIGVDTAVSGSVESAPTTTSFSFYLQGSDASSFDAKYINVSVFR